MDARPTPPAKLQRIGRYRIVRPLSKGGMALVYEGRRESLAGVSPRVAIKLILPQHKESQTFKELFINEARLGASMQHQNLVGIQDFDCEGDTYFLVMEFVEGLTLRKVIGLCQKHRIGIPLGVIAEIGRQACDGLHYAHSARDEKQRHLKLVHRDMKPSNLILNPQGVVKVLDFGISKGRLRKERSGSVKGTWGYMAPEQAHGEEVFPTADVFGLAVVLFELASLRPMFHNKNKDEIKQLLSDDHAARMAATLDPLYAPLVSVLVRALQRDPRARYDSAEDFGRALSSLLPDPITARDEVVRFFETLEALDLGKAPQSSPYVSQPTNASVPHSLVAFPNTGGSNVGARNRAGWFLTGAVSTVLVVMFVALTAVVLGLLYRDFVVRPVDSTRSAVRVDPEPSTAPKPAPVIDEPPGPAGVDAPGEKGDTEPEPAAEPTPAPEPEVAPEPPDPEPEPVRVPVVRPRPISTNLAEPTPMPVPGPVPGPVDALPPAPEVEPQPVPVTVVPSPAPDAANLGTLSIAAVQRAEVYIAGQFVQYAPVTRQLPPGRYAVSIVAMDGRRRTFEVELTPGTTISRNWDFDRMEWR